MSNTGTLETEEGSRIGLCLTLGFWRQRRKSYRPVSNTESLEAEEGSRIGLCLTLGLLRLRKEVVHHSQHATRSHIQVARLDRLSTSD